MKNPVEAGTREARRITGRDLVAGLTNAVTNIPDAMANAILAGLNPIVGLYAIMIGTPVASLVTGSQVMTVAVTGAMALIVGDSLHSMPAEARLGAVVILTLLVGLIQIGLGLARAGGLVRFVSNGVLRGFLTGVAVNIVLSQLPAVTGYESAAANKVVRALDTLVHPRQLDLHAMAIAALTAGVILALEFTPAKEFSYLAGLIAGALGAYLLHWDIPTVRSLAEIPRALPRPELPKLALAVGLVVPAVSIAVVGLIQSAGVSRSTPNRDGTYPDINRDFIGQGIGNAASGVFGGMPIGGSVGSTALVVQLGGRSRIVNFMVGPIIALVVLFLSGAVERIPLATLGAILIVVGVRAIDLPAIQTVWQASLQSGTIMLVTFVGTMVMPVQYAVLLGVGLSVVQYVYGASLDIRVVVLRPDESGALIEEPTPDILSSNAVTELDIYGSVFYAGADVIEKLLPSPVGSERPVAILRLRGRTDVGSTFITMLGRYHSEIEHAHGLLMLTGVGPELRGQLERTGMRDLLGEENVFDVQPKLTASSQAAIEQGKSWLERR